MEYMNRRDVLFPSGDARCAAWLYEPDGGAAPLTAHQPKHPIIVMAHGLAGVKEERLDAFAERFAEAGYACLVFDYRHFGASEGEPRQLLSVRRQREDWRSAIAHARALPSVDSDRVILWGSSFSGGHVLSVGAEDARVAAVIAQCPFTSGIASTLRVPPLTSMKLTALALADVVSAARRRDPVMVPAYGEPGEVALMTAPDAKPGMEGIMPPGQKVRSDVAARFALDLAKDMPGRAARKLTCPAHITICEKDTVAPAGPTKRFAAQAPRGEVALLNTGHFDIYVGEEFERNIANQLAFLKRNVPVAA